MLFNKLISKRFIFKYTPDAVTNHIAKYLYELKKTSCARPSRLFVYPTALCNDNCVYCSDGIHSDKTLEKDFIRYDATKDLFHNRQYIDKVVEDVKGLRIRDIHLFGGGEPFYYKENMFYFLERLKSTDVFIRVITNAKNLNDSDIEKIIKDKLLSQLNISFHTDSPTTAKQIYQDDSRHTHTLEVLEAITRYKKIYATNLPYLDIMFTLLKSNYDKIPSIIRLLKGHDINYLFFQPLRCYSERQVEFQAPHLSPDSVKQIQTLLDAQHIRSNIHEFMVPVEPGPSDKEVMELNASPSLVNKHGLKLSCYMPFITISLCYNGNIPLCQFRYGQQFSLSYFEIKSLQALILSDEYKSFIRHFFEGKVPNICTGCGFCVSAELDTIRKRFKYFAQKN